MYVIYVYCIWMSTKIFLFSIGNEGVTVLEIHNFFENYLKKDSLFLDKQILLSSYIPPDVLFREEQIQEIANILAPALRSEKPSNLFIFGKTGTGKTLSVKFVLKSMVDIAQKNDIFLKAQLKGNIDNPKILVGGKIFSANEEQPLQDIKKLFDEGINSLINKLLDIDE